MRLVRRDKGCVVCSSRYKYFGDSDYFYGAHIFPFEMQGLWKSRGLSSNMCDPFTVATPGNETRNKLDPLRIYSLDNGLLLFLVHHKAYDEFRFAIHPDSHKIFAFHPAMAAFHGIEVVAPRRKPKSANYLPPSAKLLRLHHEAAISVSLEALLKLRRTIVTIPTMKLTFLVACIVGSRTAGRVESTWILRPWQTTK
ncbi:hypothetical protein EI94DRAFT_1725523 [Lactarius quietus]|nr:hypothetical protein EI94DRAFT_1725523 [Lactarius quietus]